jgi:hypothetical protein
LLLVVEPDQHDCVLELALVLRNQPGDLEQAGGARAIVVDALFESCENFCSVRSVRGAIMYSHWRQSG